MALDAVFGLVMATVTASGIPEAIAAAVLVTAIGKALLRLTGRRPGGFDRKARRGGPRIER